MSRPKGSADLLEDRRRRALALLDAGLSFGEAGRQIGCNPSSVMRWRNARRRGGAGALVVRRAPGRPWKLNPAQRERLVGLLLEGPLALGFHANQWTTARISEVIEREFGVRYHPAHAGRLMHSLGWSPEKPQRPALEQSEERIEHGKQEYSPQMKKTLCGWFPIAPLPMNRKSF